MGVDVTDRTTKEQATGILERLVDEHEDKDYFQKAEVVSSDVGFGIDIWVDREKWDEAKRLANVTTSLIAPRIDRVPICVLLVG